MAPAGYLVVGASLGAAGLLISGAAVAIRAAVRGGLTIDVGLGRSVRPLGPMAIAIAAPRDVVFDVAAAPYGPRPPRELRGHVEVLERAPGMVLAAHRTAVGGDVAVTLECVIIERPRRIGFRLVRGPVPRVVEEFAFEEVPDGTRLTYRGELGTDLWALGRAWGARVAPVWEAAVRRSLERIKEAAERRAAARASYDPDPAHRGSRSQAGRDLGR
mgnify:CR=1 FL=1